MPSLSPGFGVVIRGVAMRMRGENLQSSYTVPHGQFAMSGEILRCVTWNAAGRGDGRHSSVVISFAPEG